MTISSTPPESILTWTIVGSASSGVHQRWQTASEALIPRILISERSSHPPPHLRLISSFDRGSPVPPAKGSVILWPAEPGDVIEIAQCLSRWASVPQDGLHILASKDMPLEAVVSLQRLGIHLWVRHPEDLALQLPALRRHFGQLT